jgi:MFS family permease
VTAALVRLNHRTFSSLKHRNYRLFFAGQVVSVTGTWMQRVGQAWLVLQITHSAVAVGVLALAQFLPFSTFGLFSGVLVDRLDARRTVIATQTCQLILAAVLAGLALGGIVEPWQVYVIAFLMGTVQVLDAPARQALTYRMVGRSELPNAVALNASIFNGGRVFGPAVGGLVIAAVGVSWCFGLNAISFLAVLAGLLVMRTDDFHSIERRERPTMFRGLVESFTYVRRSRRALTVLLLVSVVSMFSVNNGVLLPVLAQRTLHSGAGTYGLLSALFGAGALLGGLFTAAQGRPRLKFLLIGAAGFGAAQLVLAPERSVALALVLLFVTGLCFSLWSSNANTLLQLEAPDHLRGRVISLYLYGFAGTGSVGGLLAGWLAAKGGTTLGFAVSGGVALAAAVVAAFALRPQEGFTRRWPRSFTAHTRT